MLLKSTDNTPPLPSDHSAVISWLGSSHSHLQLDLEQTSPLKSGTHGQILAEQLAKESAIWTISSPLKLFRLWALVTKASWLELHSPGPREQAMGCKERAPKNKLDFRRPPSGEAQTTPCIAFGLSNATPHVRFIFQSPPWQKLPLQDSWQRKWP